MKKLLFLTSCLALSIFANAFSASSIVPPAKEDLNAKAEKIASLIQNAYENDKHVDFKELKGIVQEIKGSKLTLAEKVILKLNQKKVTKNLTKLAASGSGGKSQLIAAILCFFVGVIGIHRFYLGYTWQGVVQILTLGGLGIWTLIDFIRILIGDLKPKDGDYEKTL